MLLTTPKSDGFRLKKKRRFLCRLHMISPLTGDAIKSFQSTKKWIFWAKFLLLIAICCFFCCFVQSIFFLAMNRLCSGCRRGSVLYLARSLGVCKRLFGQYRVLCNHRSFDQCLIGCAEETWCVSGWSRTGSLAVGKDESKKRILPRRKGFWKLFVFSN